METNENEYVMAISMKPLNEIRQVYDRYRTEWRSLSTKASRRTIDENEETRLTTIQLYLDHIKTVINNYEEKYQKNEQRLIIWRTQIHGAYLKKPIPSPIGPRDILLKVTATTIGGSNPYLSNETMRYMHDGDTLSHEFMGIIHQVGTQVTKLHIGQRVVVAYSIACGLCEYCQRQEYSVCDTTHSSQVQEKVTLSEHSYLKHEAPYAQAEYIRVPFAEINCLPVPDDIPDNKALYLSDIIPTSYHGCHVANVKQGSTVAIWGLGPIGLLQARWCQLLGAKLIVGIDSDHQRTKMAEEKLRIQTILINSNEVTNELLKLASIGIDCTLMNGGYIHTSIISTTEIIKCTRKNGTIYLNSNFNNDVDVIPTAIIIKNKFKIIGGQSDTQKYWYICLNKICSGEFDPTIIINNYIQIHELCDNYKQIHEQNQLKCFIQI